jgi:hypothetical protein
MSVVVAELTDGAPYNGAQHQSDEEYKRGH